MDSNPVLTNSHQSSAGGHVSAMSVKPTASQILKTLPDGNTPMDVLNAIVNRDSEALNPQRVADDIRERRLLEQPSAQPELPDPPAEKIIPPAPDEPLPPAEESKEPTTPDERPTTDELLTLKDPAQENFKKLRTSLSDTKKVLKEKEEALRHTTEELESYKKGEKVPEFVFEKEKRIAELERFEKLHSLKTSREYVDTFIKPIDDIKKKVFELGKEYEVPPEVLDKAFSIQNRRELNQFLQAHFEDLDAIEAKRLIEEANTLTKKARDAELEPAKVLEDLKREQDQIYVEKETHRRHSIAEKSRKAWGDSLALIHKEGKAVELIPKPDDSEYNSTYVEPLQKAAASEYGKIISKLGELGLQDLPDDVAFYLARMTQLAHASAVAIETRQKAVSTAEEVMKNVQRTSRFMRPPVGEAHAPGNGQSAPKVETREERVDKLLQTGRQNARK